MKKVITVSSVFDNSNTKPPSYYFIAFPLILLLVLSF